LGEYWLRTNRWEEGLSWLHVALGLAPRASDHARANALLYRARLTDSHRSDQHGRDDLEASLALFRACDDDAGIAACLGHLAFAEAWCGRFERAAALGDKALEFAERTHDEGVLATALSMSSITVAGYEDAAKRARTALAHLQAAGDLYGVTRTCLNTGYSALVERRYADALAWLGEGLESAHRLESLSHVFSARTNEALARLFLHQLDEAVQTFCEALAVCHDAGAEDIVDETLLGIAAAEASRGDLARAARLTGAATGHETQARAVDEDTIWSRLYDEILTPARERYGPEQWDSAEREGAALTVHDAINLALERGRFTPAVSTTTPASTS
jgi:tetratricopeptide (TPR) repeat protein